MLKLRLLVFMLLICPVCRELSKTADAHEPIVERILSLLYSKNMLAY